MDSHACLGHSGFLPSSQMIAKPLLSGGEELPPGALDGGGMEKSGTDGKGCQEHRGEMGGEMAGSGIPENVF